MVDFMNFENYSCDNQMSIFDFIENGTKNEFNPLESLALHGTGFVGGGDEPSKRLFLDETAFYERKSGFFKK